MSVLTVTTFSPRFRIGCSGTQTLIFSVDGFGAYLAEGNASAAEVPPSQCPREYWTRRGVTEWLVQRLAGPVPTLDGIDLGV